MGERAAKMDGLDAVLCSSFEVKQIKTKPLQNQELSGDLVFSLENAWLLGFFGGCLSALASRLFA